MHPVQLLFVGGVVAGVVFVFIALSLIHFCLQEVRGEPPDEPVAVVRGLR
jgi:hypothetical protein